MSQKFPTDSPLINKKFHIADLMTIEPILALELPNYP